MEYVSRCTLSVNGQVIEDFKSVTEKEIELRRQVPLMNKTGHAKVTPRYGVEVDYAVPSDSSEFDFETVENGTLTLEFDNGSRITHTGVYCLTVGAAKIDGENELVRTITLGSEKRVKE